MKGLFQTFSSVILVRTKGNSNVLGFFGLLFTNFEKEICELVFFGLFHNDTVVPLN